MMGTQKVMINTGDATIEVLLKGSKGPLIVMLPAGGRGADDFTFLADKLANAGWRAASVNPPGAGNSTVPLKNVTLHTYAKDVSEIIKALDSISAVVLGHAWGNRVARCFAADYPEQIAGVVLLAAGGKVPMANQTVEAMARLGGQLTEQETLSALKTAFFADASDPSVWLDGFWPESIKANRIATQSTSLDDWWSGGEAPVLVVQGKEDCCALPENGYLLKKEYGDRITVIDIEDAAHALLPEQPELIAEIVIDYLNTLPFCAETMQGA